MHTRIFMYEIMPEIFFKKIMWKRQIGEGKGKQNCSFVDIVGWWVIQYIVSKT